MAHSGTDPKPRPLVEAVDHAVNVALPSNWRRVPPEKLLRRSAVAARHAFGRGGANSGTLMNLFVFSSGDPPGPQEEAAWLALRDFILDRGALFVVLVQQTTLSHLDHSGVFFAEHLRIAHPRCLIVSVVHDPKEGWQSEITGAETLSLVELIRGFWRGEIDYFGPALGPTVAGLELLSDQCKSCQQTLRTITGLVFPDRKVDDWASLGWQYHGRLLLLQEFQGNVLSAVEQSVARAGCEDQLPLTRIELRSDSPGWKKCLTAVCPTCGNDRQKFAVGDERIKHLFSLDSRKSGALRYRPLEIQVTAELLETLALGNEWNPHATYFGWCWGRPERWR